MSIAVYYAFIINEQGREQYIRRGRECGLVADCGLMTDADRFTAEEIEDMAKAFTSDVLSRYCCHVEVRK